MSNPRPSRDGNLVELVLQYQTDLRDAAFKAMEKAYCKLVTFFLKPLRKSRLSLIHIRSALSTDQGAIRKTTVALGTAGLGSFMLTTFQALTLTSAWEPPSSSSHRRPRSPSFSPEPTSRMQATQ